MPYDKTKPYSCPCCGYWNGDMKYDYYKHKKPLIKDEKIRKIVRALFDVWEVEDVKIDSNKYFLVTTIEAIGKGWKLEIPNININGVFKPTELCGEEEE